MRFIPSADNPYMYKNLLIIYILEFNKDFLEKVISLTFVHH